MRSAPLPEPGAIGVAVAAIRGAAPVLVFSLGAAGLSSLTGWGGHPLLPALAIIPASAVYRWWCRTRVTACRPDESRTDKERT